MAFEFGGMVSNSFGTRSAVSDVAQGQDMARTVANGVINRVDSMLDSLRDEGGTSLDAALEAINSLEAFHPSNITNSYTVPDFIKTDFVTPNSMTLGSIGNSLQQPTAATLTGQIQDVNMPAISATAPETTDLAMPDAPTLRSVGGAPVAPTYTEPTVPEAPSTIALPSLVLPTLAAPQLHELHVPTFVLPVIPDVPIVAGNDEPELQVPVVDDSVAEYEKRFELLSKPVLLVEAELFIGDRLVAREVRSSVEILRSRGLEVPPELAQQQEAFSSERGELLNEAERRTYNMDQTLRDVQLAQTLLELQSQADDILVDVSLQYVRNVFAARELKANAQLQLANAAASLYNARVTKLNAESELYKAQVSAQIAELQAWKAQIEAEVAKTRINSQLGQNYGLLVQALTTQADLYAARVQALSANVEQYKAQMQAVQTRADVARAKVQTFGAKAEAYIASLAGYKAQFEAYAVGTKGVIAQNQMQQVKTQISVAKVQAAGTDAAKVVAGIELQAEKLKLQAAKGTVQHEEQRLTNAIETVKAQIAAESGKNEILEWMADVQRSESANEAVAENAQSAARYFENASNSAYRAADQAFRAIISSTQAAAVAQEAAGKTAASVAQGAYSAVHVSASLQGAGRVSASEERSDRAQNFFSDMLNYTEERDQTLSA